MSTTRNLYKINIQKKIFIEQTIDIYLSNLYITYNIMQGNYTENNKIISGKFQLNYSSLLCYILRYFDQNNQSLILFIKNQNQPYLYLHINYHQ